MRIAIVGAGIGGLASAAYLARDGHEVELFEAFNEPRPVGAGLLLQPPGQDVLIDLGAFEAAAKDAMPIARLSSKTSKGKRLLDLSYEHLPGRSRNGLGVQRSALHAALMNVVQNTSACLHFGTEVTGISRNQHGCIVCLHDTDKGPFDLVLVSTGSKSAWLSDPQFGRTAPEYPWGCMWATVPLPEHLDPNTLHQRCLGARHMVGLLPTQKKNSAAHAAFYWSVKNSEATAWRTQPYDQFLSRLNEIWPDAADAASSVNKADFVHATYRDVWCKRPYHDRVWLMGDAAHGTSPQLGQGCSMALLDAQAIAKALRAAPSIDCAVRSYAKKRRLQLRYVRWASRLLTPLFQHDSSFYGTGRDLLLGPMSGLPGLYRLSLRTLASDLFL